MPAYGINATPSRGVIRHTTQVSPTDCAEVMVVLLDVGNRLISSVCILFHLVYYWCKACKLKAVIATIGVLYKKLSYRREAARCLVLLSILVSR